MTEHQTAGLTPVQWIAARAALPEEVAPLVTSANDPGALVQSLMQEGLAPEAIRCIAGALPAREGVWWAWVSARHAATSTHGDAIPDNVQEALNAVERWINAPDDTTRREAWTVGESVGTDTPVGAAAAAVFLSGGSIAPAGVANTPAPPGICGTLVSTAVVLSVATSPPAVMPALFDAYVKQGLAVIEQLGGWDVAIAKTWQALEAQQREVMNAQAAAEPDATGGQPS